MKHIALTWLLILGLTACASSPQSNGDDNKADNHFKLKIISQTASEYGAQGGLAWRSKQLNAATNKTHTVLDAIFRFDQLMLPHHVVPPVLSESRDSMHLNSTDTIRLAAHTYQIMQPARFTTTNITWRGYLTMNYPAPAMPDQALQPKTPDEIAAWDKALVQGWKQGRSQADAIYQNQLAHLQQDFIGMSLYHTLLAQHIVTPPYVATTQLGITGDGEHIRVNDKILRIAAVSQLNPHGNAWDPGLSLQQPSQP